MNESELDDYAARSLRDFAQRIDNIERNRERRGRSHPQRRSELGVDDDALAPLAISTQVQLALTMSVDHLAGVADLLGRGPQEIRLRLVALYPLLRSALECAATAAWLLGSDDPSERHRRSPCLYWNDFVQDRQMAEELRLAAIGDEIVLEQNAASVGAPCASRPQRARLGISASTARRRHARAKQLLKEALTPTPV